MKKSYWLLLAFGVGLLVLSFTPLPDLVGLVGSNGSRGGAGAQASGGSGACPANAPEARLDFTLKDMNGADVRFADHKGKVVLLNFWATWCEPCRAEMPALQALAERLGANRLVVVGVNYQESAARIERFVAAAALTFPVLLDRDGAVTRAWTRRIFPTSVLVGPDGRARQVIVGEFDWNGPQAGGLLAALLPR